MAELQHDVEMDPVEASIVDLIDKGKKQGFLTWEELNQRLPDEAITPDKLEIIMLRLDGAKIEMIDESEAIRLAEGVPAKPGADKSTAEEVSEPLPSRDAMAQDAVAMLISTPSTCCPPNSVLTVRAPE